MQRALFVRMVVRRAHYNANFTLLSQCVILISVAETKSMLNQSIYITLKHVLKKNEYRVKREKKVRLKDGIFPCPFKDIANISSNFQK